MKIHLVLDVSTTPDEPRRTSEQILDALEPEVDAIALEVPSDAGTVSLHQVRVLGSGPTAAAAAESARLRRG